MATRLNRGEIWLLNLPRPDKRRPVLALSRGSLIGLLNTVTVSLPAYKNRFTVEQRYSQSENNNIDDSQGYRCDEYGRQS